MTNFLLRRFVPDYQNTADPAVREKYGNLAGIVGIICNVLLFAGKLLAGTLCGSVSVTADAVNNLSDASSSLVTLLGFRLAARPADEKHPYGHARMEYLSGLAVAVMILVIGVELVKSSVQKILHPEAVEFSVLTAAVLTGSILLKLWTVLLACVIGRLTGLMIDGWAGLLVALFILWSGVGVVKDTVDPLLGAKPDEALVRAIAYLMTSHVNILGFHDLMVHDYGPGRRFASVHAEIDHRIDPLVAHEILDEIERQAKRELHVDLVIHYDPIVTDDPEIAAVRTRVLQIMHGLDPRLSLHDFRMVSGSHHVNVIFDMVIPPEDAQTAEQLRRQIEAQLQDGKKTYHLIVTFDTAAFNELSTEAGEQQSR